MSFTKCRSQRKKRMAIPCMYLFSDSRIMHPFNNYPHLHLRNKLKSKQYFRTYLFCGCNLIWEHECLFDLKQPSLLVLYETWLKPNECRVQILTHKPTTCFILNPAFTNQACLHNCRRQVFVYNHYKSNRLIKYLSLAAACSLCMLQEILLPNT